LGAVKFAPNIVASFGFLEYEYTSTFIDHRRDIRAGDAAQNW
jgi:hypothetical protein